MQGFQRQRTASRQLQLHIDRLNFPARSALALWLLLSSQLPAFAGQNVQGVIRDPQQRVIAGASVELACGKDRARAITADAGTFSITADRKTSPECDLHVRHNGFEPWAQKVRAEGEALVVVLQVARVNEAVTVTAPVERLVPSPLSATTLDAPALAPLGHDAQLWLDLAASAAGAFVGTRQLYIDGMPADSNPDVALIARVSVNADPFSVELGGIERNHFEIDLNEPERRWRFNLGGLTWSRDRGDALAPSALSRSRNRSAGLSGPVPYTPLTFFAQAGTYSNDRYPAVLAASADGSHLEASTSTTSRISTWSAGTVLNLSGFILRTSGSHSEMEIENAGVGGFVTPAAGSHIATTTDRVQATWRGTQNTFAHRGGLSLSNDSSDSRANSSGRGLVVTGQLYSGGSDVLAAARKDASWSFRHVVTNAKPRHSWRAGVEVSRRALKERRTVNPEGQMQVASMKDEWGTWTVQSGSPSLRAATTTAAAFLERALVDGRRLLVRTGLRGDWEADEGWYFLPRATSVTRVGGFLIESNAGLFVDSWSPALLLETARRNGTSVRTTVLQNVPIDGLLPDAGSGEPLALQVQPGFARRRDVVVQAAVRRRMGIVDAGVEQKWTRGIKLAGLARTRSSAGFTDQLDSNRAMTRQQLHARAGVGAAGVSLTAHYEFVRSCDNTDGPFSLPERQENLLAEWGRSTGIAEHHFSVVALLTLPRSVRAVLSGRASSGSPYTVTTGRDGEGLATFTDRDGLPRNGALAPAHRSVSLYASRRFSVPAAHGIALDIGLRVENLLNQTNALEVGHVAGTRWLGKAVTALAGRSVNVWMTLAR